MGSQVDLGHPVVAEEDIEQTIGLRRSQGDRVATKGLPDLEGPVPVAELTADDDLADNVVRPVLDRRQHLREGPGARPVPTGRNRQAQGLVRVLEVVHLPPAIELALAGRQVRQHPRAEDLGLQGAVEPLVLALGLWVVRARMADPDPERSSHVVSGVCGCATSEPHGEPLSISMASGRP
jgi:hypothetical protein